MDSLCTKCYGKGLCGRKQCPIITKAKIATKINYKKDFNGQSNDVFVGRIGYPNINVGIFANEKYQFNNDPKYWVKNKFSIEKIIEKRVELINSRFKSNVKDDSLKINKLDNKSHSNLNNKNTKSSQNLNILNYNNQDSFKKIFNKTNNITRFEKKLQEVSQEIALSKKETDVELELKDKPQFKINFNNDLMPHGPKENLKKIDVTSNVKIPLKVDKVINDDIKSYDALNLLNKKGFDVYYLTKTFSTGNFGTKLERKFVPTRWSITAVDDIISKKQIENIKQYNENSEFVSFFGGLKGNYYLILFLPGKFSYELFEMYVPGSVWNTKKEVVYETDYETFLGRKKYAENTVGGYYATRISITKYLEKTKKQSKVIALRFITPEYYAPLGVWYCRESVNETLKNKSIKFSEQKLILKYAELIAQKKFNINIKNIISKSKILNDTQKDLKQFF